MANIDALDEIISLGQDVSVEMPKNINAVVHAFKPNSNAINAADLMESDAILEQGKNSEWDRKSVCIAISGMVLFTSIVMVVAIVIVCLTALKPSNTCTLKFVRTNKSSIIFSSQPRSVAAGDVNSDNQLDIVVANFGTNTIGIFLSSNNMTFTDQQTYSTGLNSRPYSVTVKDFNNDNYLDIAVANFGINSIGIFLGNGSGTFGSQNIFSTGPSRPLFISTADFNKDSYLDIAVVNYGTDSIGIFLGYGNGSFYLETTFTTGYDSLPYSLAIGDFNKDNQMDIVVANYGTDTISIFLDYDNGSFATQMIYSTTFNSNPTSIAVGDFNNDNQLDIVVANYGIANIGILLGYGNGSFAMQTTYKISSHSRPEFITVGYFDNDNHLDVVVVDSENDQVHIITGYNNGNFTTLTTYDEISGAKPIAVVVSDFNNDNQSDIGVVNYGTNNLLILSGYFVTRSVRSANYFVGRDALSSSLVIYDFNNDSKLDIAVNNVNDGFILILNGIGDGTFVTGETYSTGDGSGPKYQTIADMNNDNRMDIIIANRDADRVGILFGQENGTFAPQTTYSTGANSVPWFVSIGDLDHDNQLDMVSANQGSSSVGVFLGYGNGTFADIITYSTGNPSVPYTVVLGDLNNDNHLDMIVSIDLPDSIGVFLGYGNGTFGLMTSYSTGIDTAPFMIAMADFNRDNNLDIVQSNENSGTIGIFFGNGDGTFKEQVTYSTGPGSGSQPYYVTTVDFNNDGYYDIGVTNLGINEVVLFLGDGNGNFELVARYPTGRGSDPYALAFADLNNDKNLEFIVSFWGSGYVCILTQYYAAEFANQATYLTSSAPHSYSLAVGDFNNDSRSDIVVANSGTDDLSILLGLGNGTFGTQIMYPIALNSYPQYVITGDVNKDNYIDIVSVNSKINTISVILGYGNGTFAAQTMYSTGDDSWPYAVTMSDFNNDQRVDLVFANKGIDNIGIFLGFNYGLFQSQMAYSNENNRAPIDVIAYDFNHDKHLDIAFVFRDSCNLTILFGYGNGSFGGMTTYSTGYYSFPSKLAVSDFNNDTHLDIAVANYGSDNIGIFLGYDNGSFANMIIYSTGLGSAPISIDVGDFNNDGLIDIVSANNGNNNMGILLGYGNGTFSTVVTYSTGYYSQPHGVAVGDLNNDGQSDVAVANFGSNSASVFLGYGNGSFKIPLTYSVSDESWPWFIVIADFNKDNLSDIAVANYNTNNVGILLGIGNGVFNTVATYSSGDGSAPEGLGVGDFNNDNILDIAVANNAANNFMVLFGFGDGSFLPGAPYPTGIGSGSSSIATGYFNNDTRLDLVVGNYLLNNIEVFLGYGYAPFADVTTYTTGDGSQPHSVLVSDFNNDGSSDIAVANYGTDNIGILLGNGHGIFDTMITYSTGADSAPYSVAIMDFNNDNQTDIVVTNSGTDNIAILLGHGNGTFTIIAMHSTGAGSSPYAVSTGDFNHDNISDIVIGDFGTSAILLLYGYGNGTFGNRTSYSLGYEYHPYSVAVTDLNQDKWMDIVIACYGTDKIETLIMMC